ncbi:protein FAR1-RELATED SEQUENCE 5-like isoform X2 [Macadamia integrifolia]|uniref:protein FAR1-RELATED SEQUENCE 5-like isoform X2 n=1 Tax=Macadamia integrifolia TaxID=60698 RepID=UPI001C4F862C|nr:protein FAR1-RELATED SEQUENCE 5-like isoform X2 [Macadamia integrifolia]
MESTSVCDSLDANDEIFEVPRCREMVLHHEAHTVEELCSPSELHVPSDVTCFKPRVGMEFDSLDKAFLFYNEYARAVGFSVRKGKTRKSNIDGSFLFRRFCCSKEGHSRTSRSNDYDELKQGKLDAPVKLGVNIQSVTRVGCSAKLDLKRMSDGRWVVQKFLEEHNHECARQGETHLLRSHRCKQSTQEQVHTLTCPKPSVGMEFDSLDRAFLFYNEYARIVGFSVRKGKIRKSNVDGSILFRRLCCSKEGHSRKNLESDTNEHKGAKDGDMVKVGPRSHLIARVGCKAKVDLKKMTNGKWIVQKFHEEHNHECVHQGEVHLMRSHRCRQPIPRQLNDRVTSEDTNPKQLMPDFTEEACGNGKADYIERGSSSHFSERRGKDLKMADAEVILGYFRHMQAENPSFFYAIQGKEKDQLSNFFWADARSREDFGYFGDVIYLDTIYGANKYGRPFAPIVGVNHHLQTVLFGCTILLNETEDSFAWLLKTLLKAMHGHHPVAIITNPNVALTKAIERVLPRTHHRLCLWHIFQNATKHLNNLYKIEDDFLTDFKKCLYESRWSDEFESRWSSLLDKYKLHDIKWLHNMYEKRHKWVPVYSRYIFHADMTTIQRSESINSFFNGYLNKSLPLIEFVKHCEKAVVSRREKEIYEDFKSHQTRPVLKLDLPMEQEAAEIYTRSVFKEFHLEFFDSFKYVAKETGRAETTWTYVVSRWGQNRKFLVNFSSHNDDVQVTCSCQNFEFKGILCRHILKVFTVRNVMLIPDVYIRKRWTKKVKSNVVSDESGKGVLSGGQKLLAPHCSDICSSNSSAGAVTSINADQAEKESTETVRELGHVTEEDMSITQPDSEDSGTMEVSVQPVENTRCSNCMESEEDHHTIYPADQTSSGDSPPVRAEGQPTKRIMPCLENSPREKRSREGTESSEHNETSLHSEVPKSIEHDGQPSRSTREEEVPNVSCHFGEKDGQEPQNCSRLSNRWLAFHAFKAQNQIFLTLIRNCQLALLASQLLQ